MIMMKGITQEMRDLFKSLLEDKMSPEDAKFYVEAGFIREDELGELVELSNEGFISDLRRAIEVNDTLEIQLIKSVHEKADEVIALLQC